MNERGVQQDSRYLALSTRDYNGMASDLAKSTRSFGNDISDSALRRAFVGQIASFETYKMDYGLRKAAAAGGAGVQMSTLTAAGNYWVPKATTVSATGETSNVDNRYQTITVNGTANIQPGDAFTIGNVFQVHLITKQSTGILKPFRVVAVPSGTTLVISPPIISNQGGSDAEAQYQNCVVTTQSATAPITFLNTAAGFMNPFWHKDAIELLPGRYAVPSDAGAAVMRASTDQGIELVMTKQYDINTMRTKYRLDTLYGVVNKQPEMTGIVMFAQP
jgi:hypothetical protein